MATRREFTQGSLAAILTAFIATLGSEALSDIEPTPFDPHHHEQLVIATAISAGLHSSDHSGLHPILRYMLLDEPLAPEDEWMRDRCRAQLHAVLDKLEA